jgi:acyl carrier protein
MDESTAPARLRDLWLALLPVPRVSADDRFIDAGGNSMIAARLVAGINEAYGVDLAWPTLLDVLTLGTFADLAQAVEAAVAGSGPAGRPPAVTADPTLLARIAELSDEEVDTLLAEYGETPGP